MTKIQIYTRAFPGDHTTGAKVYCLNFLKYLRTKGFELELISLDNSPGGRSSIFFIQSDLLTYCSLYIKDNVRFGRLLFRKKSITDWLIAPFGFIYYLLPKAQKKILLRFLSLKFLEIFNFKNKNSISYKTQKRDNLLTLDEETIIKHRISKFNPDVIVANYVWLSNIFDITNIKDDIIKVILTHEVVHQRIESAKKYGIKWHYSNWDFNNESEQLRKAQIILAIQNEDKSVFQQMAMECDILTMPMPATMNLNSTKQIHGRCLFVGSGGGSTNIYGLKWFLENSWPLILKSFPFCTLHVCGSVCDEIEENYKNVFLKGIVDDLEPEYSNSDVCIAPLLFGSGLKIKIIEALSYRRVSVTTSIGAQGLGDIINKAIIVADDADDFAEAVKIVISNKKKRLQMEQWAEKYVIQNLTPEIVYQPFVDRIYEYIKKR